MKMRKFFAEDPNWTLDTVTPLSDLCLQTIIKHFEGMIFPLLSYKLSQKNKKRHDLASFIM